MAPAPPTSLAKGNKKSSKTLAGTSKPAADPTLHRITALVASLPPSAPSSADLNPLADLVELFATLPNQPHTDDRLANPAQLERNRQHVNTAVHSLKHVFETLINQGRLHGKLRHKRAKLDSAGQDARGQQDPVNAVKQWLNERWTEFVSHTAKVALCHWDSSVRVSAFTAVMQMVRSESQFLTSLHPSRQAQFATTTFAHLVKMLLSPPTPDAHVPQDIRDEWQKYWNRYDDIRFHFLRESAAYMSSLAGTSRKTTTTVPPNMLSYFEGLTTMPTVSSELNEWWCSTPIVIKTPASKSRKRKHAPASTSDRPDDGSTGIFDSSSSESELEETPKLSSRETKKKLPPLLQLSAHRRVFQDSCLAMLALPMDEAQSKRVLSMLHRQVLPHMTDPKRLMDWLVDCADQGGSVGILALNGLFTLITKHNLEYPDFYNKLYALLDRDVLHVRYRPRFFRLLVVFMSSTHLPSALVASFIKRLARLSLSAPPTAAVTVIPFIYNMLKLHPSCLGMIHRPADRSGADLETDPFLPDEPNPAITNAAESSLWEIATLQHHYLASVAGLAKIFNEVMNKQSYNMEDFLDHSYATLFDTEATRLIKKAPALAPVPKRQPIGDSFFPSAATSASYKSVEAGDQDRTDGESASDADEIGAEAKVSSEGQGPVDIVSALWSF